MKKAIVKLFGLVLGLLAMAISAGASITYRP